MAANDQFRKVDDDFHLHDEVLVAVTDADGAAEPAAIVFWRPEPGTGPVEEDGPTAVEDALGFATRKAAELRRTVVVQLDDAQTWWPHWGTLI